MRKLWATLSVVAALSLGGCGYNTLQVNDEQINSSWSEILNQYQRRADLVPNLVNTVKGFAAQLTAMAFGYKTKPNFTVENEKEIAKPPKVEFGGAPAQPQSGAREAGK